MVPSLPHARALLVAVFVTLALSACGRRGALEPPGAAAAPSQAPAATQAPATLPSPVGTAPKTNRSMGFTVPKRPFILDPLL